MYCDIHGEFQSHITTLRLGTYICPKCAHSNSGYASHRLKALIDSQTRGRPTWLAVMRIEAFGIESLKVGVTTRTLEDRYKWNLRKIFHAVRLDEVTAYTFEARILQRFSEHQDKRILFHGMRSGNRWSGDTELLWLGQRDKVLEFLQELMRQPAPDFCDAQEVVQQYEQRVAVSTDREKDLSNSPVSVVGIDPETKMIKERFDSIAEAVRNGNRNVSMALSGQRLLSGGLLWFRSDEILEDSFDHDLAEKIRRVHKSRRFKGIPVKCVETGNHYHNTNEAEEEMRAEGIKLSASKITSACRGKQPYAGGFSWEYSDLSHEEIEGLERVASAGLAAVTAQNSKKRVLATDVVSGALIGVYESQADAARQLGLSQSSTISTAIKVGRSVNGIMFQVEK